MADDSQVSKVARLFDSLADVYDAVGVDFFGPIAAGLIDAVGPCPGERALDVGCGRGAALVPLARRVAPGGRAVGIDVAPRMVELAVVTARDSGVEVDARVGDAMAPAFPSASFDVIVSSLVLFFLPDPAAALAAWHPLLADGGRIGVSTFGPYDGQWRSNVDEALARHARDDMRDARTTGARGPFASDEGMEALLADTGFRDPRTVHATVSPRFADPEHWFRWSMSVGQRQFWLSIPEPEFDTVKADVLAAVDRCRMPDGRIGFDQDVRYTLARGQKVAT
jgi:ubiquinone/menaquinone biosynthesis C-methylase UbiE